MKKLVCAIVTVAQMTMPIVGQAKTPITRKVCPFVARDSHPERDTVKLLAEEQERHRVLRSAVGGTLETAPTMVLLHLVSSHHSTTELSYVAVRRKDGAWTMTKAEQTSSGLLAITPESFAVNPIILAATDGKKLDALIANPCLYAEPQNPKMTNLPAVEEWHTALVVVTPSRTHIGRYFGRMPGLSGEVVTALTGW